MDFVGGFHLPKTVPDLVCPNPAEPMPEMLYWRTLSVLSALRLHVYRVMAEDLFWFRQATAVHRATHVQCSVRTDTISRLLAFVRNPLILFLPQLIVLQILFRVRPIPIVS